MAQLFQVLSVMAAPGAVLLTIRHFIVRQDGSADTPVASTAVGGEAANVAPQYEN